VHQSVYTLTARATDDYGDATVSDPISILVTNVPPSVAIVSPTNGAVFFTPVDITIGAQASDVDGTISLVEFFRDGIKLGQRTSAPFNFIWTNEIGRASCRERVEI